MVLKALEGVHQGDGLHGDSWGGESPRAPVWPAGLGELGRNGMMITERFGARVHMPDPILTDMPLIADKPLDIGVEDFCKVCRKCASNCPTNSITFGPKDHLQRHREVQDQLVDVLQDPPVRGGSLRQLSDVRRRVPIYQAGRLVAAARRQAPQFGADPGPAA